MTSAAAVLRLEVEGPSAYLPGMAEPESSTPKNSFLLPHAEVLAEGEPRSTRDRRAPFEAPLRGAPQDEEVGNFGPGSQDETLGKTRPGFEDRALLLLDEMRQEMRWSFARLARHLGRIDERLELMNQTFRDAIADLEDRDARLGSRLSSFRGAVGRPVKPAQA